MPVFDKRYDKLVLNDDCLTDPLLMALAWKKAHDYIRTANWYADNFELDVSSIDLPNRCSEWVEAIKSELVFRPLELVPAPKTHSWEFVDHIDSAGGADYKLIWQPKKSGEEAKRADNKQKDEDKEFLKLRPLAHIGIREQTIMTLVMMCLADEVETKQGDPSTEYKKAHEKGVVSYGNRLYCRYEADKAEHSYGATTTYSKYFTDYRKFLERPYHFARKVLQEKSEEEEVYLLELDLSQFFDRIDRQILIDKIKELAREQGSIKEIDEATLGNVLRAFKDWDWSSLAKATFGEVCFSEGVPIAPLGLPQGLVASGFLANIYMANFDEHMKGLIGNVISDEGDIRLVDYCRYVDDMRLVLIGPNREKLEEKISVDSLKANNHLDVIKLAIIDNIESELNYLNLEANKKKTKVEIFRGKSIGISQTLEDIQTNVSGPVSHEDVEIHLGQLESLLALSSGTSEDQSNGSGRFNRLAAIEKDIFDIREDTLKRFAANKISRLLNNIRHFTSREIDENGHTIPGEWDYLQERLGRRLVACWSRDPALALLLKKGLELYPGTKLLEPVLEQIGYLQNLPHTSSLEISEQQAIKQAAIGNYCLAEIFRHAATVIHRKDRQAIPAHADVDGFFERLQTSAIAITSVTKTLSTSNGSEEDVASASSEKSNSKRFDFLAAQARFLLLVRLDTTLETSSGCSFHDYIFKLAKGFRNITLPNDLVTRDISAGILIASQLIGDAKPLLRASASLLEKLEDAKKVLELIAIQDAELFRSLILHARPLRYKWLDEIGVPELVEKLYIGIRPSAKPLVEIKSATPLYKLISRPDNPFDNEIMALKLMQALLDEKKNADFQKAERSDVIDLAKTKVIFEKFSAPPTYEVFDSALLIEIEFNSTLTEATKHLYSEHDDTFVLQRIALCLRAVLAGSGDPTGFGQTISPKTGYRGLKSTQYKRQIGLLTTPESLAGEAAQFSGWLTTLLSKMLKWPGIRINDHGYPWPTELTVENVRTLVEKRLAKLKECYCQQSGMPGLPELISPDWNPSKSSLVVAMVQTKMPLQKNFVEHGLYLDAPEFRVKHRKHLARVAKLVTKHIEAQHIEKPTNGEREQNIDLIILPELAVHEDDMDILIHLSRKTHAIVVAGLGFINQSNVKGPNNCAVWVVPRKHNGNKNEIRRLQGKHHMTASETKMKVQPWRPYQLMLELAHPAFPTAPGFTLTAAICFDSTDIALSADLRDKSHALMIPALNRDVNTFDSMVEALHYHMYQHVVLVNTGEYGGSYAMAPYNERYDRLIAHSSGNDQVTINTFKMNMFDFRRDGVGVSMQSGIKQKAAPAGI
ncbi:RNA-directed DNA polymerase [Vreelandella arcis]|uniref:Reverse transcriptase (RNA-dependent DNA polymerase) n=1 Tax=Vreelandella arcis TaxID=416873 RepID=A0A1G9XKR7_9GAMM|nr:RNA-directed DNA polymerase [Halomonas arcis]SDM97350.1 Reverse transcriptase (RNA-dependent DNA polymerase) [Halomonas arcis]